MADIDELQIKIVSSSTEAVKSVDALKKALKGLDSALKSTGKDNAVSRVDRIKTGLKEINTAISGISNNSVKKLNSLSRSMAEMSKAASGLSSAAKAIREVDKALKGESLKPTNGSTDVLAGVFKNAESSTGTYSNASKALNNMKQTLKDISGSLGVKASAVMDKMKKGTNAIGRVAMYRAIRTGLKMVVDGFEMGLANLYKWDKLLNGSLSKGMDNLSASVLQMKNQLGVMVGNIVTALMPVITKIVDTVTKVADWLSQLFAALSGESTYVKAVGNLEVAWDGVNNAVKEYKKQLLGLDELNVLGDNSSGGAITPIQDMFDRSPINEELQAFGASVHIALDSLDFTKGKFKLDEESFAALAAPAIGGIIGGVIGSSFGAVGAIIGFTIGAVVGLSLAGFWSGKEIKIGDKYAKLDERAVANYVSAAIIGGLIGGVIGSSFTPVGTKVGFSVGALIGLSIAGFSNDAITLSDKPKKMDTKVLAKEMVENILPGLIAGGITFAVTKSLKTSIAVGTIVSALTVAFLKPSLKKDENSKALTETSMKNSMKSIVSAFLPAGLAALSFVVAKKGSGSLLAATAVASLTLAISTAAFKKDKAGELDIAKFGNTMASAISAFTMGKSVFKYSGSWENAILAGTLTFALTGTLGTLLFGDPTSKKDVWKSSFLKALNAAAGGLIGFAFGGATGAKLGASIGISFTLFIEDIDWGAVDDTLTDWLAPITGGKTNAEKVAEQALKDAATREAFEDSKRNKENAYQSTKLTSSLNYVASKNDISIPSDAPDSAKLALIKGARGYASGGYVPGAHLFFANEDGNPEYIGNMGGRTAVANSDQMGEAIEEAAYRGFTRAMSENRSNSSVRIGFADDASSKLFKIVQGERENAIRKGAVIV